MDVGGGMTSPLDPTAAVPPAVEATDLHKTYPRTRRAPERRALDGVSLAVQPGEWVALLGPNGSGKSTLVRMVTGADAPDRGQVRLFGVDLQSAGRARADLAARTSVVFQRPGLDPLLTVQENLEAQAALFGLSGEARRQRIAAVTERLGLTDRMGDRVAALSGGLQRRADLARALLHDPDLLILDEATTGLDHQSRAAFLESIAGIRSARPRPMTVLMTTHLMDEADRAQRVVMMAAGRTVADGAPADLRAACGGRLVRLLDGQQVSDRALAVLRDAGLTLESGPAGSTIARTIDDSPAAAAALERAVVTLTRLNVPFEVAPPNLGDAYLKLTGGTLQASDAEPSGGGP